MANGIVNISYTKSKDIRMKVIIVDTSLRREGDRLEALPLFNKIKSELNVNRRKRLGGWWRVLNASSRASFHLR